MPRYRIHEIERVVVRRYYTVEATDEQAAKELWLTGELEEDESKESVTENYIDDVEEVERVTDQEMRELGLRRIFTHKVPTKDVLEWDTNGESLAQALIDDAQNAAVNQLGVWFHNQEVQTTLLTVGEEFVVLFEWDMEEEDEHG